MAHRKTVPFTETPPRTTRAQPVAHYHSATLPLFGKHAHLPRGSIQHVAGISSAANPHSSWHERETAIFAPDCP